MLKFTTFLFGLLFTTQVITAQTITGTISDSETGLPLPGATILQEGTQNGAITDSSGRFRLTLSAESNTKLLVRFIGYKHKTVEVPGGQTQIDILLIPATFRGGEIFVDDVRVDPTLPVTQSTVERTKIEQDNIGQDPIYTLEKLTPSLLTHSDSGTRFANYGYMRLRGMDQTRINMTLNGIPLNDMIDQGVFFSNFNNFGGNIQSVQVQRGVGTSTHGTASYAGSVNFESRNIQMDNPSASVKLTGGAFNSYRISSEVNTGSINNFGLYTKFSQTKSDGYRYNSGTESRSFFISGGYFGSKNILKVTAFSGQTQNELAYTPVAIDQIRDDPRVNTVAEHDEDIFNQQFFQLQYGHSFTDRLTVTSSLYYGGAGGDFPVGFSDANGNFIQDVFGLKNNHYGFQTTITYLETDRFELSGGVHTYRFDRENFEYTAPLSQQLTYHDNSYKDEFSSFIKSSYSTGNITFYGDVQLRAVWLSLNPDRNFLLQQGVNERSTLVPTRSWTFLSPKIGIAYFINDHVNIYTSLGRSGREPTRQDILGATNINPGNLDTVRDVHSVQAEYVNDVETGIRFSSPTFSANLNAFYMKFDNEISPTGDFIPEGFVQLRENIDESIRSGIETEWQWRPVNKFSFSGNATWMKTNIREFRPGGSDEVFTDVESILSPEWLAHSTLTYFPLHHTHISLSGRYMGEAFLELTNRNDLKLPSFFIVDVGFETNINDFLSASLKIHNLFDELYFTNGAPVDTNADGTFDSPGYIVQPPRHLFFEITVGI